MAGHSARGGLGGGRLPPPRNSSAPRRSPMTTTMTQGIEAILHITARQKFNSFDLERCFIHLGGRCRVRYGGAMEVKANRRSSFSNVMNSGRQVHIKITIEMEMENGNEEGTQL